MRAFKIKYTQFFNTLFLNLIRDEDRQQMMAKEKSYLITITI